MTRYIIRRILQAIPLLFIISVILFALMMNMGDPLATLGGRQPPRGEDRLRLARQLGLDQPIYMQYVFWLIGNDWMMFDTTGDGAPNAYGTRRGILRGDWGTSLVTRRPVVEMIWQRLPNTLLLMGTAQVVIIVFSLAIGVYSALRQYSVADNVITTGAFIGYSMPIFWLALMLMYIFAVNFKKWGLPYFPTVGMYDPAVGRTFGQVVWHMALPVATLSVTAIAAYSRYIRASMLEVINQDYIRTARSKGLPERLILWRHALKNASLPLVTLIGLDLPLLLAGAVVTERIFAWPGMGRLFLDHVERADYPVLMGILMLVSVAVVVFQILTDIVYTYLDPRIRYS
ncbi:ABC transporter permease [Caldilinea sp.]|uniref:ABC transporter permease n=1 Tax=Caldilinea sp. TaxID=2293560 RepID=UPI0021DD3FDF|nr:ABC transporter permease [Caldilinea sp.]GIV69379.1 MAG: peptide ABC transporter permease [Caldilinea sp.]